MQFSLIRFAGPVVLAGAMLSAPALAQSSPVVGTWNTEARTDFGTFAATMTVAPEGDGYVITIVDAPMPGAPADAPPMASTIDNVVVDGARFSFRRGLDTPQGAMELTYQGTVEGDTLRAEVNSAFGTIPVTGTRVR